MNAMPLFSQITAPTFGGGSMPTILTTSYDMKAYSGGNPGTTNKEADNATLGWTTIITSGKLVNSWSAQRTLPFTFKFWGTAVTKYYVSQSGLISFTTSTSASVVSGDNTNLPSTNLTTNPTIACYWDQFTSAPPTSLTSKVMYKVFGTSPNRQVWIKWFGFEIGKGPADKCYFACVLEETTNKIYIVDMTVGTAKNKATIGVQTGSNAVQYKDSIQTLASATSAYTDNTYILFAPFEIYPTTQSCSYTDTKLSALTTSHLFSSSGDVCLENELDKAAIRATLNLGDIYNYGSNAFLTSVTVNIVGYNTVHVNHSTTELFNITKTLSLTSSHPEEVFYADISEDYAELERLDVKINSYDQSDTVKKDVSFKVALEEDFKVNVLSNGYDASPMLTINQVNSPSHKNPITLSWNTSCDDVSNYQVQVLRLQNTSFSFINDTDKVATRVDWDKALNIETQSSSTSLKLTLAEGSGFYIWRVRPIGNYYEGGIADSRNWGLWSDAAEDGDHISIPNLNPAKKYAFYYQQFDQEKNWIYSRSFSEDNKIKETMGYANGLQQSTQSQIHLQSDDTVLVAQKVYDYVGHSVVQSLPAPVGQKALDYYTDFMQTSSGELFSAKHFDADDKYLSPDSLGKGKLYRYYSNSNPDTTIPIAGGYPYTRTIYYPDGTGRVQEQGGLGKVFRIGSTESGESRTVKISYSGVSNPELEWVFGDEAPVASSVYKKITEDQNKELSVEYISYQGKTIATCLANNGRTDNLLDDLESKSAGSTVTDTIASEDHAIGYTLTRSQKLPVTEASGITLNLHYDLSPVSFEAECVDFCKTCDYTVIVWVNDLNDLSDHSMYDTIVIPAFSCDEGDTSVIYEESYHLDKGDYYIGRTLIANNTNTETGNLYLDDHKAAVEDSMNVRNEQFDTLFTLLDNSDIDGFNAYLVDYFGITQEQIDTAEEVTISTGDECCDIVIPIPRCETISCDNLTTDANGNLDVEKILYETNGVNIGSHAYQYFYDLNGNMKYPLNAGSYWYVSFNDMSGFAELGLAIQSDSMDTATVLLPFDVTLMRGTLIGSGMFVTGNTQAANAATAIEYYFSTLYDNTADYPYTVFSSDDTLFIYPNFTARTYFGGSLLVYDYLSTDIKGRSHGETVVEIGDFVWGDGAFNAMFSHMVNIGDYDCDSILAIAQAYFSAYLALQYDDATTDSVKNSFDLLEAFLSQAGKQYKGFNKDPYGSKGYLEYAYEYFKYDTTYPATSSLSGRDSTCETMYNLDSLVAAGHEDNRFDSITDKNWEQFYNCINGDWSTSSLVSSTLASACSDYDYDCITAMAESLTDSCEYFCEEHRQTFFNECYALYSDSVKAWCLAEALVEYCKGNCTLTVSYHIDDWNSDGVNDTIVDSAGTAAEVEAMMMSMAYAFDVEIPTIVGGKPVCSPGYDLVLGDKATHSVILVDVLNSKLSDLRNNMTSPYRNVKYNVINKWITQSGLLGTGCDLLNFNFIRVYQNAFSYPSEFTIIGDTLYYYQEYNDSLIALIKQISKCDAKDVCGEVCFKWIAPVIDTSQTILVYQPCEKMAADNVKLALQNELNDCVQDKLNKLENTYTNTCLNSDLINEHLILNYQLGYYHYTLYYYDRGGNLVKTVPPKGVDFDDTRTRAEHPSHTFETTYEYNSLNQLVKQETPDGGRTRYYFNNIGQLRFSQNANQYKEKSYSYIKYDELGRMIEAGESTQNPSVIALMVDESDFPRRGSEKIYLIYSQSHADAIYVDGSIQENLQNRLSYAISDKDGDTTTTSDLVYTFYSYDVTGNTKWMIHKLPGLDAKYIAYEFDLISNKITEVKFNEGKIDQFYQRYTYDEDNRISMVETSRDAIIWDRDATYKYYIHGLNKRTALGEDHIQGLDFVYTLQGWLKSVNAISLSKSDDPGHDGKTGTTNSDFAADAYSTTLSYFENDFEHQGSVFSSSSAMDEDFSSHNPLYNGTIAAWANTMQKTGSASIQQDGKANIQYFSYDELNRLTNDVFQVYNTTTKKWASLPGSGYCSSYSYDANGNMDTLIRKAYGSSANMDYLVYNYQANTNKLRYIDDAYGQPFVTDLPDQSNGNYTYDELGNLTKDVADSISKIGWCVGNKVDTVNKANGTILTYLYDAMGNKIKQTEQSPSGSYTYTYYLRDAGGKVIGIYSDTLLSELPIYAGERIGLVKPGIQKGDVIDTDSIYDRTLGKKYYELKDHLGNVRAVVSDIKLSTLSGTTFKPGTYRTNLLSMTDYYPFGMEMPGRSYQSNDYRFGFNGMEKMDEISSNGNNYDYGARLLNPRAARWFSLDPLANQQSGWSPYKSFLDNPIMYTDPTGMSETECTEEDPDGTGEYVEKGAHAAHYTHLGYDVAEIGIIYTATYTTDEMKTVMKITSYTEEYLDAEKGLQTFNITTTVPELEPANTGLLTELGEIGEAIEPVMKVAKPFAEAAGYVAVGYEAYELGYESEEMSDLEFYTKGGCIAVTTVGLCTAQPEVAVAGALCSMAADQIYEHHDILEDIERLENEGEEGSGFGVAVHSAPKPQEAVLLNAVGADEMTPIELPPSPGQCGNTGDYKEENVLPTGYDLYQPQIPTWSPLYDEYGGGGSGDNGGE